MRLGVLLVVVVGLAGCALPTPEEQARRAYWGQAFGQAANAFQRAGESYNQATRVYDPSAINLGGSSGTVSSYTTTTCMGFSCTTY